MGETQALRPVVAAGALLRTAADALAAALFSSPCVVCGAVVPHVTCGAVCDDCWRTIQLITPPLCPRCGDPLHAWQADAVSEACGRALRPPVCSCGVLPRALDVARALGPYEGTLRVAIHALKYGRRRSLANRLARLVGDHCGSFLNADALVPVPLHRHRQWTRGFNQTEDVGRHLGLPVWRVLRRVRHTPSQSGLNASERVRNVRHAFAPQRLTRLRRLAGARVILFDDVSTTGATLGECAEVLKGLGIREVRALTLARTLRYR